MPVGVPETKLMMAAQGECPLFGEKYHDNFDPMTFLASGFPGEILEWHRSLFKSFHEFFQSYTATNPRPLKVLDFGAGPTIAFEISTSRYASEIVLAEYTEKNRKALQLWLDRNPRAHNWTPYFQYVIQELEGRTEQEATEREEQLRKVIKAVVPCDISQHSVIESGYDGPYDVVLVCLCLTAACSTRDEYRTALLKLLKLLGPGGKIIIVSAERPETSETSSYPVGSKTFLDLIVREEFVTASLEQAGFSDIVVKRLPPKCSFHSALLFTTATR